MENCFVKKLKSSVNSENLKSVFNGLLVYSIKDNSPILFDTRNSGKVAKVKMVSGTGTFTVNGSGSYTEYTIDNENARLNFTTASASNVCEIILTGADAVVGELNPGATCVCLLSELFNFTGVIKFDLGKNNVGAIKDVADMPSIETVNVRITVNTGDVFTPTGKVDDIFDSLFEQGRTGTYYLQTASSFVNIPHSNKFAYNTRGTYTVVVNSEGWTASFTSE